MPMSPQDRRAVLFGAAVIALGLLAKFAVMPAAAHWSGLRTVAAQGEARLADIQHKLDRRDAILARQRQRFGPGVEQPIESVQEVWVSFPQAVQQALSKAGLKIESVELQGVRKLRKVPGVSLVSLRVRGTCGPDALPKVLASLQSAKQLIIVDRFDISMVKTGARDKWSVTLMVSTPAIPEDRP